MKPNRPSECMVLSTIANSSVPESTSFFKKSSPKSHLVFLSLNLFYSYAVEKAVPLSCMVWYHTTRRL
jgi:hypothetical protein